MYKNCFKRIFDFVISLITLIVLSPLLFVVAIITSIKMKGNPFFIHERPGYKEKIFKLIKFRSMTEEKDANGEYLPDEIRLTKYGEFIRRTSIDELPEFINVLKGDMSIVGPRPLEVRYLPRYTKEQHRRHNVKPGITGLAMATVRNNATWEKKFELDLEYVDNISLWLDIKIIFMTIKKVLLQEDINEEGSLVGSSEFWGIEEKK